VGCGSVDLVLGIQRPCGKGWRVACFDGALAGWIVGVSVGVRLSSVEGLVNLCSWLVGVHRDLGLDKVGREWLC